MVPIWKVANRPLVTLTGGSQSNPRHNRADYRHKFADTWFTQLSNLSEIPRERHGEIKH